MTDGDQDDLGDRVKIRGKGYTLAEVGVQAPTLDRLGRWRVPHCEVRTRCAAVASWRAVHGCPLADDPAGCGTAGLVEKPELSQASNWYVLCIGLANSGLVEKPKLSHSTKWYVLCGCSLDSPAYNTDA